MRMGNGARLRGVLFRLAGTVLIGLGGTNPAWTQAPPPQPAPAPQPAQPASPAKKPSLSLVFPDGGFPESPPAPEGGIPPGTAKAGPNILASPLKPPAAGYAPPGYEPGE